MKHYKFEATEKNLKGTITCGSKVGYEGDSKFDLTQVLDILDQINKELNLEGIASIPCIVVEGELVGRSDLEKYREKIYNLNFAWCPRVPAPSTDDFYETLKQYVNRLGNKMQQERIYVEFEGDTVVYKRKD
ncbi:hypothetical protein HOK51_09675 [Candidatus Woesearchaeota archaeon]|jgi:hypothetical protein|nr:hypothetical protein [Candidatus Woesearchaeota archaeon]MBT6520092.1 hypothetical protein [Candidatus Woesearchaeota archaeon]MBT7366697.1 hypothetical protein [Candidatus Woesearchaeota archaeon]